jgi:hypothetical protein
MSSENKDKILSVIGKNYDTLTWIDNKVIYIAVGENHFIYQNCITFYLISEVVILWNRLK